MFHFRLPDMDCGGCVKRVTRAVQSVDPNATVEADLETRKVKIETSSSEADIIEALDEAGYGVEKQA